MSNSPTVKTSANTMSGLTMYESDILARGLDVIFCGLNPAASVTAAGHNFSNPSNRFWPVLHLAGFTGVRLRPQDEHRLLEFGCGITAAVRRPTRPILRSTNRTGATTSTSARLITAVSISGWTRSDQRRSIS